MKQSFLRFLSPVMLCLFVVAAVLFLLDASVLFADQGEQVVKITAKRYEYNPNTITVKMGRPVVLEFDSLDRLHGFSCPGLAIRADIPPGKVTRLKFVPHKTGQFPFHCDIFCGEGHGNMTGTIIVEQ